MSLEALAERAACAKSYLSEIENERRAAPPSVEVLGRIELALCLSAGTLVELAVWERTPGAVRRRVEELETRERAVNQLVDLVSRLSDRDLQKAAQGEGRDTSVVGRSLDVAYKSGALKRLIESIHPGVSVDQAAVTSVLPAEVPLINSVAAGYPTEFTDLGYPARVADEYVRSPEVDDPDAFAARVVGESMLPEYREGDIVIFSPSRIVKSGMDCFVRLERDQESTFKRVFFQASRDEEDGNGADGEWIRLQPLNPRFAVRVVHREEVGGLYAAVSVTRAVVQGG